MALDTEDKARLLMGSHQWLPMLLHDCGAWRCMSEHIVTPTATSSPRSRFPPIALPALLFATQQPSWSLDWWQVRSCAPLWRLSRGQPIHIDALLRISRQEYPASAHNAINCSAHDRPIVGSLSNNPKTFSTRKHPGRRVVRNSMNVVNSVAKSGCERTEPRFPWPWRLSLIRENGWHGNPAIAMSGVRLTRQALLWTLQCPSPAAWSLASQNK